MLRMAVPAQGMPDACIDRKSLAFLTVSTLCFAAVGAVALYGAVYNRPSHATLWAGGSLVAWFCAFAVFAARLEPLRRCEAAARTELDIQEWERLEAAAEGGARVSERNSP